MKLLGAREFIKMPAGIFYMKYWENSKEECIQIIEEFKKDPKSFLEIEADDLEVFGDNSGSMMFSGNKEDNYIFYYDANVVGDANPSTTLYLVIDENELPDEIPVNDDEGNIIQLSKDEIIRIKNIFVNEVLDKMRTDEWAINYLDELSKTNNVIDINISR